MAGRGVSFRRRVFRGANFPLPLLHRVQGDPASIGHFLQAEEPEALAEAIVAVVKACRQ